MQVPDEDGKLQWSKVPVDVSGIEITLPNGETEVMGGMDDDIYSVDENTQQIPESGAHRGMRTVCECGFRWGPEHEVEEWKNRPLKKRQFFECAKRLVQRFEEAGASFDEDSFFEQLDEMKSDPDEQFADDSIFERAFEYASTIETVRSTS